MTATLIILLSLIFLLLDSIKLMVIYQYFYFVKTFIGKALFYFLMASMLISQKDPSFLMERAIGIYFGTIAILLVYVRLISEFDEPHWCGER